MRAEPDWQALPPDVPPAVRALIHGCLQKDRASGWPISRPHASSSTPWTRSTTRDRRLRVQSELVASLAASTALIALLGGALLWTPFDPCLPPSPTTPSHPTRARKWRRRPASISRSRRTARGWFTSAALLAVARRLLRRNLDELDAVAVPGSEGASAPVVSPDGRSVAFLANGAIRTLPLGGGPPFTVVTAGGAPTWSDDGLIYYGRGNVDLSRVCSRRRAGCGHGTGAKHPPATSRRAPRRTRTAAHADVEALPRRPELRWSVPTAARLGRFSPAPWRAMPPATSSTRRRTARSWPRLSTCSVWR